MRPPVVEHLAATPRKAVVAALGTRAPRRFSASMFIGRKLRALYDDDEQPCPSRLTELLQVLCERPGRASGQLEAIPCRNAEELSRINPPMARSYFGTISNK